MTCAPVAKADRVAPLPLPLLSHGRTTLVPLTPDFYQFITRMLLEAPHLHLWRYRGRTPSPDEIVRDLWNGVLAQFVVVSADTGRPVGLVVAYNADLHSGTVYLAAIGGSDAKNGGIVLHGFGLFLGYLFGTFRLRKAYIEVAEYTLPQFGNQLGRFFHLEGRLREHEYLAGRYWDHLQWSITREQWSETIGPLYPVRSGNPKGTST